MTAPLARFAAAEFHRRRDALIEAHGAGRIATDRANVNAQSWLAIARAAGADLPEMYEHCIWPRGKTRLMNAKDIAAPETYRAELTRARDVAVRKSLGNPKDLAAQQRSWDLQALAVHLGCPETTQIEAVAA